MGWCDHISIITEKVIRAVDLRIEGDVKGLVILHTLPEIGSGWASVAISHAGKGVMSFNCSFLSCWYLSKTITGKCQIPSNCNRKEIGLGIDLIKCTINKRVMKIWDCMAKDMHMCMHMLLQHTHNNPNRPSCGLYSRLVYSNMKFAQFFFFFDHRLAFHFNWLCIGYYLNCQIFECII